MKKSLFYGRTLAITLVLFGFSTTSAQTSNCQCYDECMNIVCCELSYHTEYTHNNNKIVLDVTGFASAAPLSGNIWNFCEGEDFKKSGCRQPREYLETTRCSKVELNTVDAMFMQVTVYNILNETVVCSVMAVKEPLDMPASIKKYLYITNGSRNGPFGKIGW